jgi:hypothetical protein
MQFHTRSRRRTFPFYLVDGLQVVVDEQGFDGASLFAAARHETFAAI